MATRKIGPALAAGNTVVVKPASLTPLTTMYLVKIFEEVGVPKGVINVITTRDTAGVSNVIMEDDRLRKVSFTGSTPVGINLMKQAADKVLRTSMELGGNAPFVVFEDADLDKAVEGVIAAKFRNIGQACTAANRIYVQKSIADEFSKRVSERVSGFKMGRGTEEASSSVHSSKKRPSTRSPRWSRMRSPRAPRSLPVVTRAPARASSSSNRPQQRQP